MKPPSLIHKYFSITEEFWNAEGTPYEIFRSCETKNFQQNHDTPLLCIKIFATRVFLKHRRVILRSFSVLCDKKFSKEHRDIPLFCIELFNTRNFLIYWRVLQEIFWHCETKKNPTEKRETPHLLSINIFPYQKISESPKGPLTKFFGTVRPKNFNGKQWYPLLMHKTFRYPKFSETLKGSPTKFFGTVRQKISDGKLWHPHLLSINFFHTRNFRKYRRDPLRRFLVLWDKKFSTKPWCPSLIHENFRNRNFLQLRRVLLRSFAVLWDKRFSTENRDIPFSWKKFFRYPKFSDTPNCSPTNFFGTVRQKIWTKSRDTPSFEWNIEIGGAIDVCRQPSKIRF